MNEQKVTLTLYPNAFGLSYVISKSPKDIIDFGKKMVRKKDVAHFLKIMDGILDYFKPEVVILRDYNHPRSQISARYKAIWKAIESKSNEQGLKVFKYSREQIREVFASFEAKTKFEISEIIASWYPQLKSRSPRKRKPWMSEDNQMSLFDSFSLMLSHAYLQD